MRVVIANFTGERPNWGCQATSWELHRFCREVFKPFAPVELATVPNPPVHILDEFVERVHGDRISEIFASPSPSRRDLQFLEEIVDRRFDELAARIRDSDIVIFQGEGTMGPKRHFRGVRFFGLPFLAKQLWGKPVISLNQSFYAARPHDLQIAKNVYKNMEVVALREDRSYAMCQSIGLRQAILCPDMAFRARGEVSGAFRKRHDAGYFCISGSAALGHYRLEEYLSVLSEIVRTHGIRPVFLHSKRKDSKLSTLARRFFGTGNFDVVSSSDCPSYIDVLPILRGAEFVIGGRYHTSVMALAQAAPVVLLPGNTYKTEGLGHLLGMDIPVFPPSNAQGILDRVSAIMANKEESVTPISSGLSHIEDIMAAFGVYVQDVTRQIRSSRQTRALPAPPPVLVPVPQTYSATNIDIYRRANLDRRRLLRRFVTKAISYRTYVSYARTFRRIRVFLSLERNKSLYDSSETVFI